MTAPIALAGTSHGLTLAVFAAILVLTAGITVWAARRTRTAADFWAAGRSITAPQNGLAISGDYLSAAAFLGTVGLIFLVGFDGLVYTVPPLLAFIPVLIFIAERMRNLGKYTFTDALAARFPGPGVRIAAASSTLAISLVYLVTQLVAAGALLKLLAGVDFSVGIAGTAVVVAAYVVLGGMLATTWVQIVKAALLLTVIVAMVVLILIRVHFDVGGLFSGAAATAPQGDTFFSPGNLLGNFDLVSTSLAFILGVGGLPHILMRFFTVRDSSAALRSTVWAIAIVGVAISFLALIGLSARSLLIGVDAEMAATGGNLVVPTLAQLLGGGAGSVGGDLFLAVVSAIAFATLLAALAGVLIAASGAVAHDVFRAVVPDAEKSEAREPTVARLSAIVVTAVGALLALAAGTGFNVAFLVSLALAMAASANLPALLLTLYWRGFTKAGAITGIIVGLLASVVLIILTPPVWAGPDSQGSPLELTNPAIISIPLGFIGCIVGTAFSRARVDSRRFDELVVRAETGIGAELGGA